MKYNQEFKPQVGDRIIFKPTSYLKYGKIIACTGNYCYIVTRSSYGSETTYKTHLENITCIRRKRTLRKAIVKIVVFIPQVFISLFMTKRKATNLEKYKTLYYREMDKRRKAEQRTAFLKKKHELEDHELELPTTKGLELPNGFSEKILKELFNNQDTK